MSTEGTASVTVTEHINEDGSKTITTVTIHEDGSKTTKRKTIRPKRSKSPIPGGRSPKLSPTRVKPMTGDGSMEDALERALQDEEGGYKDDDAFEKAVRRCIPSEFLLIASQDDATEAQEAHHAAKLFGLPNPKGQAGSVAISALLQYLYKHHKSVVANNAGTPLTCLQVLQKMHANMKKAAAQFDLKPQIAFSRPLGPPRLGKKYAPFYLVPPNYTGRRRALLIGICFVDDIPSKVLKSPHNDVHNVKQYLVNKCGFVVEDMMILTDGEEATATPTKENILASFQQLIKESKPGDVNFIQFSGHGGRVLQPGSTDSYDSYILPSDYKTTGQILDDDILKDLIKAMPVGVYTTFLVDCCNSGNVGDLPYILKSSTTGDQEIEPFFHAETREEILEAEAKCAAEREEYKKAKAERKRQRELQKAQREKDRATAQAKEEEYAAVLAAQLERMNNSSPTMVTQMTPADMGIPTMLTFTIRDECELAALSKKYGVTLALTPEQKTFLGQGGTVTMSLTMQPQSMSAPKTPMICTYTIKDERELATLSKKHGVALCLTPEQKACLEQGGTVMLSFTTQH